MEDGLLSLKWNNHRSTFFHVLSELRNKAQYSDVTLACDGELFPTHKLILSTCSDYFASMLESTHCKAPIIVLKDVKKEHLVSLLRYMYLGEAEVRQNDLSGLIKAAECLRIKGLAVPDRPPDELGNKSTSKKNRDNKSPSPSRKRARRDSGNNSVGIIPPKKHVRSDSQVPSVNATQEQNTTTVKTECTNVTLSPRLDHDEGLAVSEIKQEHADEDIIDDSRLSDFSDIGDNRRMSNSGEDLSRDLGSYNEPRTNLDQDSLKLDQLAGPSRIEGDQIDLPWQDVADGTYPHHLFDTEDMSQQHQMIDKWYGDEMDLIRSATSVDKESGIFKCIYCHYQCTSENSYRIHIQSHEIERPYKCQYCSYRSAQKQVLIRHERRHTGEKPYRCRYCNYSSTQKGAMHRHERTHTGEKPFKCNFCDYTASLQQTVKYHISKTHQNL